jgi:hypothetical protein
MTKQQQDIKPTTTHHHQDMCINRFYLLAASQSEFSIMNNNPNIRDPHQTNLEFLLQTLEEVERILEDDTGFGDCIGGLPSHEVYTHISSSDTEDLWSQREPPSKQ